MLTGSPEKAAAAKRAFEGADVDVRRAHSPYPETQAASSVAVARATDERAVEDHDVPVVREDHSLLFDAVPGLSGSYLAHFDDALPGERPCALLDGEPRTGRFETGTVVGWPDGRTGEFGCHVDVEVADRPAGDEGNCDRALRLPGAETTFAASDADERRDLWGQNLRAVARLLDG